MESLIKSDQIRVNVKARDSFEAITKAADLFLKKGMVKESFTQAVIEREKVYPTGLETIVGVALPHAEENHVRDEGIAIVTLSEPVEFSEMGNPNKKISVTILFLLAIKNPALQLEILEKIIRIIQNEKILYKIKDATDSQTIVNLIDHFI